MKRTVGGALLVALFVACGQTRPSSAPESRPASAPPPASSPAPEPPPADLSATTGFGCAHECQGSVTQVLAAALRERGLAAKTCYDDALKKDPSLRGRLVVGLQLAADGSVCASRLVKNTLHDAQAVACIRDLFVGQRFPAPEGGCLNVALPLAFVTPDAGAPDGSASDAAASP